MKVIDIAIVISAWTASPQRGTAFSDRTAQAPTVDVTGYRARSHEFCVDSPERR